MIKSNEQAVPPLTCPLEYRQQSLQKRADPMQDQPFGKSIQHIVTSP